MKYIITRLIGILTSSFQQQTTGLTVEIIATQKFQLVHEKDHFHVKLKNNSNETLRIWKEWNSWGYFNLSFEVLNTKGEVVKVITKNTDRIWTRNAPTSIVLAPNKEHISDIYFSPKEWDNLINDGFHELILRPIYTVDKTAESQKHSVWTGKIIGEQTKCTINYWKNKKL